MPIASRHGGADLTPQPPVKPRDRQLLDDYCLGEQLGQGAFGIVYSCTKRNSHDSHSLAVKMVDKVESPVKEIEREVELLRGMDHPNVIRIYKVYYEKVFVCIVMDRYSGGDLINGMQRHWSSIGLIPPLKVLHIKRQMALALAYLHSRHVVHRDIKGDNYLQDREDLLDENCRLVLTDFGTACKMPDGHRLSAPVGTRTYWSPEFFSQDYGLKVDTWALGVVVYGLVQGRFPFKDESAVRTRNPKLPSTVPADCVDLIKRLLAKDEHKRLSAAQAANHRWVRHPQEVEEPAIDEGVHAKENMLASPGASAALARLTPGNTTKEASTLGSPRPTWPEASEDQQGGKAVKEGPPAAPINERRAELVERLEDAAARKIETQRFHAGQERPQSAALRRYLFSQDRFEVNDRHSKRRWVFEWWLPDKVQEYGILAAMELASEGQPSNTPSQLLSPSAAGAAPPVSVNIEPPSEDPLAEMSPGRGSQPCSPEMPTRRHSGLSFLDPTTTTRSMNSSGSPSPSRSRGSQRLRLFHTSQGDQDSIGPRVSHGSIFSMGTCNEALIDDQAGAHLVQRVLQEYGISTSHFGKGAAKSLMSFSNEVHAGQSRLMLDASEHKKLVRVVDVVVLRLWVRSGVDEEKVYLVEDSETLPDGRTLPHLHRLPASKKRPYENTRKCAERVLVDVLNLGDCQVTLDISHREAFEQEEDSKSYPGVRTVYRKELVEGEVLCSDEAMFRLLGSPGDPSFEEHAWHFEDKWHQTRYFKWLTQEQCEAEEVRLWANANTEEISGLVPAVPAGFDEEVLTDYLKEHGIDTEMFGKDNTKTLKEFSNELCHGECALAVDEAGQAVRFVDVVLVRLTCEAKGGAFLVVTQESTSGAPLKETNRLPGTKRNPNENYFLTARRVITRQLKIDENLVDLKHRDVRTMEERTVSDSYPGITTLYRKHIVPGEVNLDGVTGEMMEEQVGARPSNFRWLPENGAPDRPPASSFS